MACLTMVLAICNFNCTPSIVEYDMHIPIVSHESHEKEKFSITPVITLKQSSYVIMDFLLSSSICLSISRQAFPCHQNVTLWHNYRHSPQKTSIPVYPSINHSHWFCWENRNWKAIESTNHPSWEFLVGGGDLPTPPKDDGVSSSVGAR